MGAAVQRALIVLTLLLCTSCAPQTEVVYVRATIALPDERPQIYLLPSLVNAITDEGVDFDAAARNVKPTHVKNLLSNQEEVAAYVSLLEALIRKNNELAAQENAEAENAVRD